MSQWSPATQYRLALFHPGNMSLGCLCQKILSHMTSFCRNLLLFIIKWVVGVTPLEVYLFARCSFSMLCKKTNKTQFFKIPSRSWPRMKFCLWLMKCTSIQKLQTGVWIKNLGSTVSCIINDLVFLGRVSPQTELAENGRDEKETRKQESEQGSKEKAKSNPQGMAPGLG